MRLHHDVLGPSGAPPLLMGGSLGTTVRMWDRQAPLAEKLRLVRFDHRGHGSSPTPPGPYEIADLGRDVLELMDGLGLERASYCGLSIGGMVGIWLAANAPERIEALVLICSLPYMPPRSKWQARAAAVLAAGSTEPIADAVLAGWLTPEFAAHDPDVRASLRAMLVGSPAEGYAACCGAIERMDLRAELPRISAPTLLISGSDDPSAPPAEMALVAAAIPSARQEVVSPAAHIAAVEQAQAVNELILEHVSGRV